jgi:hypothetical protein
MLKIIQRFGKHCSFHLQGEYVSEELDLMVIIGGAEEWAALYKASKNDQLLHIRTENSNRNVCRNVG